MNKSRVFLGLSLLAGLGGCAEFTDWRPTIDYSREKHQATLARDMEECKSLAGQASSVVTEAAKGTAIGGVTGAAAGAAIGAPVGDPGVGAAIGAAAGGIGGGVYKGVVADEDYKYSYSRCMKLRGHAVLNP